MKSITINDEVFEVDDAITTKQLVVLAYPDRLLVEVDPKSCRISKLVSGVEIGVPAAHLDNDRLDLVDGDIFLVVNNDYQPEEEEEEV